MLYKAQECIEIMPESLSHLFYFLNFSLLHQYPKMAK